MFKRLCFSLFFVSIFMVIGCGISGTIEQPPMGPVADVEVTLSGSSSATTTTDADGQYSFDNLMPGSYVVSADLSENGDCGIINKPVNLLQAPQLQTTVNFSVDECLGACCLAINSCSSYITEDACYTAGGTFYGEGSDCLLDAMPCSDDPIGTCCETDDSCTPDVTEATCDGTGGTWTLNGTCGFDVSCGPPTGACCEDDAPVNTCTSNVTEATCTDGGGTWTEDGMCDGPESVTCGDPIPTGACCADGTCIDGTTQSDCEDSIPVGLGGTWTEDGECSGPVAIDCTATAPPVIVNMNGFTIQKNMWSALSNSSLKSTDADSPTSEIIYKVISNTSGSNLLVDLVTMNEGDTFTQADVDISFKVRFQNVNGIAGSYPILLEVKDADGNDAATSPATITFTVIE